jgi:hypothetical protein
MGGSSHTRDGLYLLAYILLDVLLSFIQDNEGNRAMPYRVHDGSVQYFYRKTK